MLDPHILSANPRPTSLMHARVDVQKTSIVSSDSPIQEGWNLYGKVEHFLQRHSRNVDIGCHAQRVFAVCNASSLLVVRGTAVSVVDDDLLTGQRAQQFEGFDQSLLDFQIAAAVTGEFHLGKVQAQVAHVSTSFLTSSSTNGNSPMNS
jgi:hypothetical protein